MGVPLPAMLFLAIISLKGVFNKLIMEKKLLLFNWSSISICDLPHLNICSPMAFLGEFWRFLRYLTISQ